MATDRAAPAAPARILVVGLPRSGTTWVGRALGAAAGTRAVGEPDNEDNFAYALKAKRGLGRYPIVLPGERPPAAYEALWDGAFAGGRAVTGPVTALSDGLHALAKSRTSVHESAGWAAPRRAALATSVALSRPCRPAAARHVVVKSVFAPFALRWVCERWAPRVVLVTRSSLNTVASWLRLGWDPPLLDHPVLGWPAVDRDLLARLLPDRAIPPMPPTSDQVRRLAWELGVLDAALLDAVDRLPDAVVVRHADLCADPLPGFRRLYDELGLEWTDRSTAYLEESNTDGSGTYDTRRVAGNEAVRWRGDLSDDDAAAVTETVAAFGHSW
jgi:hypothetical protein